MTFRSESEIKRMLKAKANADKRYGPASAKQNLARDFHVILAGLGLNQFNWIVGPVLLAYARRNAPLAIVVQGHNSFAVVNEARKEYLGCCPTLAKAIALVEKEVQKNFS